MQITTQTIDDMVKRNGRYYVPENIKIAIENCLDSDDEGEVTDEYRRLFALFQSYETKNEPIEVDYKGPITLDAYTTYYLCRNMFIPSIALRDLSFHPLFQNMPSRIKVLDLGSGTGAVTLGLLSMFSQDPLSRISLEINALDCCAEALDRQKDLITEAGFDLSQVECNVADVRNTDNCLETIKVGSPYDLVFVGNCFTEIPRENAIALAMCLPEILANKGAIIIAEAQRNYTKALIKSLALYMRKLGLSIYYPCPTSDCPYPSWCWVWRYNGYEIPDMRVNGKQLQESPKDELVAIWLIVTNQGISIYDPFRGSRPDLLWGPISKETGKTRSICSGNVSFEDRSFFSRYRRGHIVGLSDKSEVIEHYKI